MPIVPKWPEGIKAPRSHPLLLDDPHFFHQLATMSNAEPSNTPPPQYTPAPAAVPATRRKKGEATDIHPHIADKIKLKYIEEFETKVKKHDPKFTGSKVVDTWRKTTSEAILQLIKSGTPPFQNIALTEGQRKNNLNVSSISS